MSVCFEQICQGPVLGTFSTESVRSGHRRPSTQKKMRVCCCRDTRRYHKSVLKLVEQQDETFAQEISAIGGGRCRAADRLTGRRGGNPSRQLPSIASEQGSHRTYNSE